MEESTIYTLMANAEPEEIMAVKNAVNGMDEETGRNFIMAYRQRRKDPETILGGVLVGIIGIHGIHRFMLNQVGWGLVYLFTMGFCKIGWVIDIVNYKKMTLNYNLKQIQEMSSFAQSKVAGF